MGKPISGQDSYCEAKKINTINLTENRKNCKLKKLDNKETSTIYFVTSSRYKETSTVFF